ncbi:MAG TPA: hypothetical protein VF196_03825 [Casimicrobiaceae bacterium]
MGADQRSVRLSAISPLKVGARSARSGRGTGAIDPEAIERESNTAPLQDVAAFVAGQLGTQATAYLCGLKQAGKRNQAAVHIRVTRWD